ncbi:MAG: DVUA0089 family protein, partial [Pirellulaceae bacterium]
TREVLAVNDDYFSRDSLIEVSLSAGVYYIGVTASGNAIYDPTIADTGLGGKSQGQYELRLNFRSQVEDQHTIRDADGERTPLDGDTDGVAGGVYNFWFQTQPVDRIIEVLGDGRSFSDGQIITITNSNGAREDFEFNAIDGPNPGTAAGNVAISFRTGAGGGVVSTADEIATELATKISAVFGNDTSAANDDFAKAQGNRLVFNSSLFGHERQVQLSTNLTGLKVHGRTIFVDKTAGPNADGSAGKPFNNLARAGVTNAFSAAQPGDIIRVVGNGGTDGNLTTLNDNFAYEVGFGTLPGQILSDGTELAVPKGVTVMVEPGTVFKMRRSRIGVGSSSTTVDRSGGAFQVLGTPEHQVYFTSWLDQTIGLDTHPPVTSPGAGDWGGIVFRDDVDRAQSRVNLEDEGIFLNYVNHADIRYGGGGNVVIDSVQQVVNPIQIVQTRPTVTFNRITNSADSAMSATPDSFDESNFHSPRFQQGGEFTSDYQRVGPDIYANYLANNSNNGLFIRIETPAGDVQQPLTVSGRFDDTDIVHILSENLLIQGSGGSPFLDLSRPSLAQVSFTNEAGGFLNPFTTYSYKITFVDANGFEGRPSEVRTATTANNSALRLDGLPPASGDFIRRRIYRTDDPSQGYQLVAEINATDRVYIDNRPLLGTLLQRDPPAVSGVTLAASARGSLTAGVYNYRIVFVNAQGEEGASSDATSTVTLNNTGGVNLNNLPAATGEFVSRRLYRSTDGGIAPYYLAAELDATSTQYRDDGLTQGDILDVSSFGVIRARPSARLALDPGTVLKMEGSRIETGFKAQFIAEGVVGQEVIITSRLDDSYGVGGTFDTNNDNSQSNGEATPRPGNWGGLFLGPLSSGSIDHALIAYGGGITQDSGTFVGFNAIEVHQSELRLTNSILENNAEGVGGQGPLDRFGRGYNRPATIFVRGAQPIIVDNIIRDNNTLYDASKTAANLQLPVISINANSLISDSVVDIGRSRGLANRITEYGDNQGPLVRGNQLANNAINGMVIRGEELTSQSVWDDTDIVHVVTNQFDQQDSRNANRKWAFDEIVVPEHHTLGGLRLVSSSTESLVVKFLGAGQLNNTYNQNQDGLISNSNPYNGAGITVYGRPFEIEDRIGGTLQIVGQPGFPVVLTSLHDDSVGAGVQPDDSPQSDTNNNGIATVAHPNDWRSIRLDQYSNDRNVDIVLEMESRDVTAPGLNATTNTAQVLGNLASDEQSGDENQRMGFEIRGFLNAANDVDVYSFTGVAGTEVWIDLDRTTYALDTVVELLDASGNVLARSDDAIEEVAAGEVFAATGQVASPLRKFSDDEHQSGLYKDFMTTNARDAGMRVALPGVVGSRGTFHVRVRSRDGLTSGTYQMQIRARENDEFPGSTVRYATVRYANNGIEVIGLPGHSPLLGEASENENVGGSAVNDFYNQNNLTPGNRPQVVGNLLTSDRGAISIAGEVSNPSDIDFYSVNVVYDGLSNRSTHHASAVFDVDYADALVRFNSSLGVYDSSGRLVLFGRNSNVAEDRPGPLNGADLEDLSRGTIGPNDPFIGPVELPEGQYYTAVMADGRLPRDLEQFFLPNPLNSLVRLEPIDSLVRIAEDHIDFSGGSTASAPVVPKLVDATGATGLWNITTNRASDSGHGIPSAFDGSRSQVSTGFIEVEANDSIATAQFVDFGPWNLNFDSNIEDAALPRNNISTTIPHLTLTGTGDDSYDYFRFTVPAASTAVPALGVFDIDAGNFDSEIALFDSTGALLASNDDNLLLDNGSTNGQDAFLTFNFTAPGTYYLGVATFPAQAAANGFTGTVVRPGSIYTLQMAVQGHGVFGGGGGAGAGASFYFGDSLSRSVPTNATGTLTSNPFSLKGYSAEDLPTLYFNYFLGTATGDNFRVSVRNAAGNSTLVASNNAFGNSVTSLFNGAGWRQARVNLGQFAGQDGLRLVFEYADNSVALTEGAYIDDLIIGFAERGEMVSGTFPNGTFSNNPQASSGDLQQGTYQLEIRTSSEYGRSSDTGSISLILDRSFDTNDRLTEQTTLIAPAGSQVVDGQTFTISDGVNSVTFEFDDPSDPVNGNRVRQQNVAIPFKSLSGGVYVADADHVIARRIRDAINSPQLQTTLRIRAALSDGTASGTSSTSNRINLFGQALVDQPQPFSVTETTTDANQLRDTILGPQASTGLAPLGNARFVGSDSSAGMFAGGTSLLGLKEGIVLSTGDVRFANGPNQSTKSTGHASGATDADLNAALAVSSRDTTSLEFDFTFANGVGGDLFLNFVFASEEYQESIATAFRDAIAILLDEGADGTNLVNLALTPAATPVSINSINPSVNPTLYRDNSPGSNAASTGQFGYDGFTTRLVATATGLGAGPHRIKIVVGDTGDNAGDSAIFVEASSMATSPLNHPPEGIASVRFQERGDANLFRDQGVVLIHSNTIEHSKNFGIVSDAGERDTDGQLVLSAARDVIDHRQFFPGGPDPEFTSQLPIRLESPHPGPSRNLIAQNLPEEGGFVPGVVIVNNTIAGDGLGGIHVSGNSKTYELTPQRAPSIDRSGNAVVPGSANWTAGDMVSDGDLLEITAFGQVLTFEWEDMSGSGTDTSRWAINGSATACGDGWDDGNIPIFYRRTGQTCASDHPVIAVAPSRTLGFSPQEMAIALKDAIDSSPLITNDSTLVIQALVGTSRVQGGNDPQGTAAPRQGTFDVSVYLEHVTNVREFTGGGPAVGMYSVRQVSHAVAPQPFTRVINNTIVGGDGNYSFFPEAAVEPNDTIGAAIDTRQGKQHYPESYTVTAAIGDTTNFRGDLSVDVDVYQFQLDTGDHVVVDVDALVDGSSLQAVLRLFNQQGQEVAVSRANPGAMQDPLIDFTATASGTYYVGISGAGNEVYNPISLSDRTGGASTGDYSIDINVLAPRQYVLTVENASAYADGEQFRITDVNGQSVTFEFDTGGGVAAGNVAIPINAAWRHPEVARVIEQTINNANNANNPNVRPLNNRQNLPNGLFGVANPVSPVAAEAYGGPRQHEFTTEFTGTPPEVATERFVVIRNLSKFEDVNSGIYFNPNPSRPLEPTPDTDGRTLVPMERVPGNTGRNDLDQILPEHGVLVSEQATPTVLNNIFSNLRMGVEQVSFQAGSPGPVDAGAAVPGGMVEGGSLYQDTLFNSNLTFAVSDFNIEIPGGDPLFVNAAAHNFFPAPFALSIDSSIDTLADRSEFAAIRSTIGLSPSPILAPDRDSSGQLRVDDPDVATPSGLGANVFKDRGALDRSDFVGPTAVLVLPQDNDALHRDQDSAVSVVQLDEGIFASFTIQLIDGFESADPFPGVGIDDQTIDGRTVNIEEDGIPLQISGPAVTIFQNGTYLREGLDYTFQYDRTSNTIVLTPLAGVWPEDKVYVVNLNNRDRFVIDAPSAATLVDGQAFTITNDQGEKATFEFDSGFSLQVSATLGIQVPLIGAGVGGIIDGHRFTIETDNGREQVTFEFDRNQPANVLPGNEPVPFELGDSPDELAGAVLAAIQRVISQGRLHNLQPRNLGGGLVHLGATPDVALDTSSSALSNTVTQRPISLNVPSGGAAAIADNETFIVRNGQTIVTFEFDKNNSGSTVVGSRLINLVGNETQGQVAALLASALALPALNLQPANLGNGIVSLGATANHSVNVTNSSLTRSLFVGGVRDGEQFTVGHRVGNTLSTLTVEFDNNGQAVAGNTVIPFTSADSHLDLANRIVAAVMNGGVGLDPIHVGQGSVNLGGDASHSLDARLSPSLTASGQAGASPTTTLTIPSLAALQVPAGAALTDGATFSITEGVRTVIFEFDRNGVFTDVDNNQVPDNQLIRYQTSLTSTQIANAVSAAIASANIGLSPQISTAPGVVLLNGLSAAHTIDFNNSGLFRADRVSGITDGQTFTIDDGTRQVTFEFENLALANGVAAGNETILFDPAGTVAAVASTMAAVIRNASLGLDPQVQEAAVELRDQPRHLTDSTQSSLLHTGVPGGGRRVVIRTNATDDEVAQAIVAAINAAQSDSSFDFDGVSAQIRGGSTLFVNILNSSNDTANFATGTAAVSGINNFFLSAIKDIPGNSLKSNQTTDQTQFTILLPGVELDFGDAPDPFTGPGRYPTLFDSNGARHVISDVPIFLGSSIDSEPDGQPSLSGVGDDADHLIDVSGSNLNVSGLAPYLIQVPAAGGAAIQDGDRFTIRRSTGVEVVFEFNSSGGLSNANHAPINYSTGDTANELANKIRAAVDVVNKPISQLTSVEERINRLALRPTNLGNGVVFLGGEPTHEIDTSGSSLTQEGTPASLLHVPVGGGSVIIDGETLIFDNGIRRVTLEFNQFGSVANGNIAIPFTAVDTVDEIVAAIRAALPPDLGITLSDLGGGVMHVASEPSHTLDLTGSPALRPAANAPLTIHTRDAGLAMQIVPLLQLNVAAGGGSALIDGQSFTIDDGINPPRSFEFDLDPVTTLVNPEARRILFIPTDTQEQIVNSILAAVQQAVVEGDLVGVNPSKIDAGGQFAVNLGAGSLVRLHTANAQPALSRTGPVKNADMFSIGGVVFEFDSGDGVVNPNRPVLIQDSDSTDAIVNRVVTAIKNAVLQGALPDIDPVNIGEGIIDLGTRQAGVSIAGLPSTGTSGGIADGQTFTISSGSRTVTFEFDRNGKSTVGNVVVPFQPDDSASDIASSMASVVDSVGLNLTLANLGNQVRLEGDDDDGVVFNGILKPGASTSITVTASADGLLSAWFDWNQDGDWDDPSERIFADVPVVAGANTLFVPVPVQSPAPSTLPLGDTFARFRFSSKTGLFPTGLAEDGEVEDYKVRVLSNASPVLVQPLPDQTVSENFDANPADDTHIFQLAAFFDDVDIHNGNGDFLRFDVVNNSPSLVSATIDAISGELTLQLVEDANGTADLLIRVTDHDGQIAEDLFQLIVTPVNGAPVAGPDGQIAAVNEGAVNRPVRLPADDGDPEIIQGLTINILSISAGTLADNPASTDPRDFVYTAPAGFVGNAVVRYTVTDDGGKTSSEATVTIAVEAVNDPPTFTLVGDQAGSGDITISEDAGAQSRPQFVRNISAGSPDEAGQTVNISVTGVTNGSLFAVAPSLVLQPDGTYTLNFTPAAQTNGASVVTVNAADSGGAATSQSFTLTVIAQNDAPVLTVPAGPKVVREGDLLAVPGIQVTDVDAADGDGLIQVTLQVGAGTLTVSTSVPNGVTASQVQGNNSGQVTLISTPSRINTTLGAATGLQYRSSSFQDDTLNVVASDRGNTGAPGPLTAQGSIAIDVLPLNSPPVVANSIGTRTMTEDGPPLVIDLVPGVFTDPDLANGDTLTFSVISVVSNGSAPATATISGNSLTLSVLPDASGQAVVTIEARDRLGLSTRDTFTLSVTPQNDPPSPQNDEFSVPPGVTSLLNVLSNDSDIDSTLNPASVVITVPPNNATATVNSNGTISFRPNTGFLGTVTFRYRVSDVQGAVSPEAQVTVLVNNPPAAANDSATMQENGGSIVINVLSNDSDSDGSLVPSTVTIASGAANGTTAVNPQTGAITYTPNAGFDGVDVFQYTVRDNQGGVSNPATVTVTVTPVRHWTNPSNAMDVNADGSVSPIDVLSIVNRLNREGPGPLPDPVAGSAPPPYVDANGDGQLTP